MRRRFCVLSLLFVLCLFAVSATCADEGLVQELSSDKLFFDNFDEGIRPEWTAVEGKWRMVNGALQPVEGAAPRVELDALDFGDGIIEFKTGNIDTVWGKRNELQIGVKRQDGSEAGYWFKYYDEKLVCYLMTESGETLEFYQEQVKLLKSYEYNIRIEIKKDIIKMLVNGEQVCVFSDDAFNRGFISIVMKPSDADNPYPWIDDFTIYE